MGKTYHLAKDSEEKLMDLTFKHSNLMTTIETLSHTAGEIQRELWDNIFKEIPREDGFEYSYAHNKHTVLKWKKDFSKY